MYSVPFTILVVVSCQWSTVHSIHNNAKINGIADAGVNDCSLWVPDEKALKMPVPFNTNEERYSIIYPDIKGRLNVKFGQNFGLSCTSGFFKSKALPISPSEVLVKCAGGDSLVYNGHTYAYDDFECDNTPKSELKVTGETCQSGKYTVVAVGFQTKDKYLKLYNVCFDKSTKNSLYTWYEARSPYYDNHQNTGKRPNFVNSEELYGKTNVNKKYNRNQQRITVAKILRSYELAEMYMNDNEHSLSRGHYAANADFFFGFEQRATFYFANVAPQWQSFNGHIWKILEEETRHKLANDTFGRHLIVTGTYGLCTLADVEGVQQPLFLDLPGAIPVPLFYWKLVYDQDRQDGTVYVGLNNPYKEIDDSAYICPNTCPGGFDNDEDANNGLIYCCTKETFERAYGQLDPIVFRRN